MELVKTTVALYFLMLAAFLNFFLLTVIHDIIPRGPRLPDLVFSVIEQQRWAWAVGGEQFLEIFAYCFRCSVHIQLNCWFHHSAAAQAANCYPPAHIPDRCNHVWNEGCCDERGNF